MLLVRFSKTWSFRFLLMMTLIKCTLSLVWCWTMVLRLSSFPWATPPLLLIPLWTCLVDFCSSTRLRLGTLESIILMMTSCSKMSLPFPFSLLEPLDWRCTCVSVGASWVLEVCPGNICTHGGACTTNSVLSSGLSSLSWNSLSKSSYQTLGLSQTDCCCDGSCVYFLMVWVESEDGLRVCFEKGFISFNQPIFASLLLWNK